MKKNSKNNKEENTTNTPNRNDMVELTNAVFSYMANSEEEPLFQLNSERQSDLFRNSGNNENILDEEALSKQLDEKDINNNSMEENIEYEELSEEKEKRIFYSALYLSGKPIEMRIFQKMLNPLNLENRLLNYAEEFNNLNIGIRIRMVSGGYQVVTDSDVTYFLEKYFGEKTETLSRASLETVAIIAYKQPITKSEVEELREVNSSGTMKYLLDKNLIKVEGRKQVPGKPLLYVTTKYFLEYFGLNDLSELPTFREWQELKQNQ